MGEAGSMHAAGSGVPTTGSMDSLASDDVPTMSSVEPPVGKLGTGNYVSISDGALGGGTCIAAAGGMLGLGVCIIIASSGGAKLCLACSTISSGIRGGGRMGLGSHY